MTDPHMQSSPGGATPRGTSDGTAKIPDVQVVINDEDQYSIWPLDSQPPAGWRAEGFTGGKQECLDHIDQVWTDMRPRSVRERLAEGAAS